MKRYLSRRSGKAGFTIIELLVATLVFSVVLVILLVVFVRIGQLFYKGVNMSNTQNAARTAVQDIEDDIRFSRSSPLNLSANAATPGPGYFCIGTHRYTYYIDKQVDTASPAGIYRENILSGCPSLIQQPVVTSTADQLLSSGTLLDALGVACGNGRCIVNIHIVFYGSTPEGLFASANYPMQYSNDPWDAPDAQCTGALTSSQYCAAADFNRTVLQRI